jgi:hypothetical protein
VSDPKTTEHPSKPASVAWDDFLSTLYVGEQIHTDQVINLIDPLLRHLV